MLTTLSKDLVCEASTQTSNARRISTEMKTQTLLTKTIIPIQSLICRFIQRNKSQLIRRFRDDKLLWRAHQNNLNCAHQNIQALTHKTKCRLESWCSKWPKKGQRPRPKNPPKKVKIARKMTLLFLQRIMTPTPPEPAEKKQKCAPGSGTSFFLMWIWFFRKRGWWKQWWWTGTARITQQSNSGTYQCKCKNTWREKD